LEPNRGFGGGVALLFYGVLLNLKVLILVLVLGIRNSRYNVVFAEPFFGFA